MGSWFSRNKSNDHAQAQRQYRSNMDASSITKEEFDAACKVNHGKGTNLDYTLFIQSLKHANITHIKEGAKYLAHTVWECAGMSQWREALCYDSAQNKPTGDKRCLKYGVNQFGDIFYGRGPLQLTHHYNYKPASKALYPQNPDQLVDDPDLVARNREVGWNTAAYFWKTNVHSDKDAENQTFGQTLEKINGAMDCKGGENEHKMMERCMQYRKILKILNVRRPKKSDCYCVAPSKPQAISKL